MIIKKEEVRKDILLLTFEADRVDLSLGRDLKRELLSHIEQKYRLIIVDLHQVQFMDSSGLGILVLSWQEVTKFDGKICFISLSPSLKKLFSIAKIDQFVNLYNSVEEAIKDMEK